MKSLYNWNSSKRFVFNYTSTPLDDGFRMPGEFEHHKGCWLLWPERTDVWPFGAKPAQQVMRDLAISISKFEKVTVGVSSRQYQNARGKLPSDIRVVEMSYNGCWIRDTGPTFVVNVQGAIRGVDWIFNAWGGSKEGLYFPWDQDDLVASKILDIENIDRYRAPFVLEGGAIHVDGEGTMITTESCLLNANRNAKITKKKMQQNLISYLGVKKIIWLRRGINFDHTGGHVDNICAFARPGVVLLAWEENKDDPQFEVTHEAYQILSRSIDAKGKRLEIHKIPLPDPLYVTEEESNSVDIVQGTAQRDAKSRLPASYINFYLANDAVIVPLFDDSHDEDVIRKFEKIFPERKVVGVKSRDLLIGGGNVHCNVQQQPNG